jgi:hypothetical protein
VDGEARKKNHRGNAKAFGNHRALLFLYFLLALFDLAQSFSCVPDLYDLRTAKFESSTKPGPTL